MAYMKESDWRAIVEQQATELEQLRAIAGGGRCVECGQVEPITADGRLAAHHDAATDEMCIGSGESDHEPPNLTVRVLDNDDRKDLERLRAVEQRALTFLAQPGWGPRDRNIVRRILGEAV